MKWLLGLLSCTLSAASLSCRSESGVPVDSWLIIKAPRSTEYLYADPSTPFQPSIEPSLNQTAEGAVAYTTQQLWKEESASYFIYNDEDPMNQTYSFSYGHLKGYGALDETSGTSFWVQHSVPKFLLGPSFTPSYAGFLPNAWENAQHMICFTLPLAAFQALVPLLTLTRTRMIDMHITPAFRAAYPAIADWIGGATSVAPVCQIQAIYTKGGMNLTVFEKSAEWGSALWDNCVAPELSAGLRVQSWLQGTPLGPNCSDAEPVVDVTSVEFATGFSWAHVNDHSKWGLADDGLTVCLGDINRVTTQAGRGGGAVCLREKRYVTAFTEANISAESCSI